MLYVEAIPAFTPSVTTMFPESILSSTPHSPGVYLMRDARDGVLYVGKAKDLNKRLASYARFNGTAHSKTSVMLNKVSRVETILTRTEKEALILEERLIKQHQPKYNILLRDDKSYPYIKVTIDEEWPRVFMVRRKSLDKARYFGPYAAVSSMWSTLHTIAALFPLRHCKGSELRPRSRPCLNRQIGRCLAPCTGLADHRVYLEHVGKILMLLEGRSRDLVDDLRRQMLAASEELDFEKAVILRDQIKALTQTLEKQVVAAAHDKNQDVFGFARQDTAVVVAILLIRHGTINGSRTFFLADPFGDDGSILSQAVCRFYDEHDIPAEILLPFTITDGEVIEEHLGDKAGHRVVLKTPQRGDAQQLVAMASANALQSFEEEERKNKSWENLGNELVRTLGLERMPQRIECVDISNIGGQQAIGSLVSYVAGLADKRGFRRYTIKSVEGPNDYAMMHEVLERRLRRGMEEESLPDLLLVDGGKGQLGVAMAVVADLGLSKEIDLLGIAKERQDEGEKLFRPRRKNPILLPPHNPVLLFLMRIRDEAHRFGITTHRRLRQKSSLASPLDTIPGIGKNKKLELLRHFGSYKRLQQATLDDLLEVRGIGPTLAATILAACAPQDRTKEGKSINPSQGGLTAASAPCE